jgi:uncharacterized membrane protein YedE/YeeE
MTRVVSVHAKTALLGIWLGFVVSQIGYSDYGELTRMLTFADPRMMLAFAGGLALSIASFQALRLLGRVPRVTRRIHKGSIPGGVLFGAGWAIAGACPAVPLIQLGEGKLAALATCAGVAAGMVLFGWVQRRFLRWDVGSCLQ